MQTKTPKVSVCIPVYNVEEYIGSCIESVLNQSFQEFEIIIINDSTPDCSMDIVNQYAKMDTRIRVYENSSNMGLMWARREGYLKAKGDYVCFLDSDDTLPKESLELLYNAINESRADIVCGQIAYISAKSTSLTSYPNKLLYGDDSEAALKSTLRWEITHNLCGKIYKRELLQSYKYITYEQVINAEDAILFYQLLPNISKIGVISEVVYNYYQYGDSSTNAVLTDKAINGIFLWQKCRWQIVNELYPHLGFELRRSMVKEMCSLVPSIGSNKIINDSFKRYSVPFVLDLWSILKYTTSYERVKCCVLMYLHRIVRIIRYTRIKSRSVN
jgi:glycosyltransferase involved in cell wall biosynthesis